MDERFYDLGCRPRRAALLRKQRNKGIKHMKRDNEKVRGTQGAWTLDAAQRLVNKLSREIMESDDLSALDLARLAIKISAIAEEIDKIKALKKLNTLDGL